MAIVAGSSRMEPIVARSLGKLWNDSDIEFLVLNCENLYITGDKCNICDLVLNSFELDTGDPDIEELMDEIFLQVDEAPRVSQDLIAHFCAEHEGELTLATLMVTV